jgi:hypothetical protein
MTVELSVQEKIAIIDQHLKSIEYSLYNNELDLIEANAATPVDASVVSSIESKISATTGKKNALLAAKADLEA